MRFGKINNYVLFGGGVLMFETALNLVKHGKKVLTVTSPRHYRESLGDRSGPTLGQSLETEGVACVVSQDVNNDECVMAQLSERALGLSFGAAWIFRQSFIDRFEGRLLNLHGARLPQDRGSGGFSWQILRGNHLGCCLIHQVESGIDTGPVIKHREFVFPNWCRIPIDYQQVYIEANRPFLTEFFDQVDTEADFPCVYQPEYLSAYWPRLSTEHQGFINWTWTVAELERFICAFDEPYEGASTFLKKKRVFLKNCRASPDDGSFHPFQAGMVFRKSEHGLFIATNGGTLLVRSVTDELGVSGSGRVHLGDRFHTPVPFLDSAAEYRAIYTPEGLRQ